MYEDDLGHQDPREILEGHEPGEVLTVEVQRELVEALIRQRHITYELKRIVDDLRRYKVAVDAAVRHRPMTRAAFAAITWADDLETAKKIAASALTEEFDLVPDVAVHDEPPSSVEPGAP